MASIAAHFRGPTAIAISYGDPVGLAKILCDFAKDNEKFALRGGVLEGTPIARGRHRQARDAAEPRCSCAARSSGLLLAPATKLARLLLEPGAQLARLADARSKQGEAASPARGRAAAIQITDASTRPTAGAGESESDEEVKTTWPISTQLQTSSPASR